MADPAYLINPSGETVEIPADQVQGAKASGYTPASPDQIRDFLKADAFAKKYGTTGQKIATAAEGAADTLTLGLATPAAQALGITTAEDQKARQEANPEWRTGGEILGAVLPAAISAGSSLLPQAASKAASMAAPSLISKLGQAGARTVEQAITGGVAKSTMQRLVGRAAAQGVGSAIEGAAYGLGQVVHEAALGDPNMTAQSALAHIGLSAALGGGIGGAFGAAEIGIPAAIKKSREVIGNAFKKTEDGLGGLLSKAESVTQTPEDVMTLMLEHKQDISMLEKSIPGVTAEMSSSTPEMAQWILNNKPKLVEMEKVFPGATKNLSRAGQETADYLLNNYQDIIRDPKARIKIASTLREGGQEVIDSTNKLLKDMASSLDEHAEHLLQGAEPNRIVDRYLQIQSMADEAIATMEARPSLYKPAYAEKLKSVMSDLTEDAATANSGVDALKRLRTLRRSLADNIDFKASDFKRRALDEQEAQKQLKAIYNTVSEALHDPETFGKAAVARQRFDDAFHQWNKLMDTRGPESFRNLIGQDSKINAKKLNTWLNDMAGDRGSVAGERWGEMMDLAKKVADDAAAVHELAPVKGFDQATLEGLLNKAGAATAEARQKASVSQLYDQLTRSGIRGSGPVVPNAEAQLLEQAAGVVFPKMITNTVSGTVRTVANQARGDRAVLTLAALERMGNTVANKIDAGASTLVRQGARAFAVGRGEAAAGVASSFGLSAEESAAQHLKRISEISRLGSDPAQLQEALTKQSEALYDHAPNTSQALSVASARGVAFLQTKLPQRPKAGPLANDWKPSRSEIAQFNRYYEAVNKPMSIMKQAAAGTLTPEAVEAVRTVYPDLYAKMSAAIVEKLAVRPPNKLPYQSKLMISMLLGQDMDGTTSPAAIALNQQVYAGPSSKSPQNQLRGAIRPTSKAISKISVANRLLTPAQASNQRR